MSRTVSIGCQDFETIRNETYFYIDKTQFIKEWWEQGDSVTLIARPRRFGKTLTMNMLEKFFSVDYTGRGDLFEGLAIWQDLDYRKLQGTRPVLFISFADVKETTFVQTRKAICRIIKRLYNQYDFLLETDLLNDDEKDDYRKIAVDMEDSEVSFSLKTLSDYLYRYYGKKVIILLDEYDTPMQEAYVNGYWDELASFVRGLLNASFKTNPYLERAIMTGITRISIASSEALESIFSDLNNLEVVTTTSEKYADFFGFTEEEVFAALEEFGLSEKKEEVKSWYDGFRFGQREEIYNPWSILNYLDKKCVGPYWANSSSNKLIGKLLRESNKNIKQEFEALLRGESIYAEIDEQIIYNQLDDDEQAIWSLLLASGYMKVRNVESRTDGFEEWKLIYELGITNFEVKTMFRGMVRKWFGSVSSVYNDFVKALLADNLQAMNLFMNDVAMATFSYFDTGKNPARSEPERFYHGFILGLLVELSDRYLLTSNRESGFGRYDVMLEAKSKSGMDADDSMIMEFKVQDGNEEKLSDTVREALEQIERQNYESVLVSKGVSPEKIRKYGFAFLWEKGFNW